jgi:hypothetical protein
MDWSHQFQDRDKRDKRDKCGALLNSVINFRVLYGWGTR